MDKHAQLEDYIKTHPGVIGKVVDFDPENDRLYKFDFTSANKELEPEDINHTGKFSTWVNKKLKDSNSRYGIGGYMEHRTLYARSELFNADGEPRRLHLGVDIWADAGTAVFAPLTGRIHSFADNDRYGDYGPTIIIAHQLGALKLYSLYGHLDRDSLEQLSVTDLIPKGKQLGKFGNSEENGHWPPHLHFQLMFDLEGCYGDYPGVARFSEKHKYLKNIPDPNLILQFP